MVMDGISGKAKPAFDSGLISTVLAKSVHYDLPAFILCCDVHLPDIFSMADNAGSFNILRTTSIRPGSSTIQQAQIIHNLEIHYL